MQIVTGRLLVSWFVETSPRGDLPQNIQILPEMLLSNVPNQNDSVLAHYPWCFLASTPVTQCERVVLLREPGS